MKKRYNVLVYYNNNSSKSYLYRLEFRCNLSNFENLLKYISAKELYNYFIECDSEKFFLYNLTDFKQFYEIIKCENDNNDSNIYYGIEEFVKSTICEKITNEIFIKNKELIKNISKNYFFEFKNFIGLLNIKLEVIDFYVVV